MIAKLLIALLAAGTAAAFSAGAPLCSIRQSLQSTHPLQRNVARFAAVRSPMHRAQPLLRRSAEPVPAQPLFASALLASKHATAEAEAEEPFIDTPGIAPYLNMQGLLGVIKFSAAVVATLFALNYALDYLIVHAQQEEEEAQKEFKAGLEKLKRHGYDIPGYH